jgi:hypothetical protein
MKVMNHCLFVDVDQGGARGMILGRALRAGGRVDPGAGRRDETLRVDFETLPPRETLLGIAAGAHRAASLEDAEIDWIIGGPIGAGRLMWTLTESQTGDPNAVAN